MILTALACLMQNRGQHGVPPQPQQPQQQQQKLQHQQHAAKVSQGGQVSGLVMQPGMHTQGPQGMHAHQQMIMQGHQGQPNQPSFAGIPAPSQYAPPPCALDLLSLYIVVQCCRESLCAACVGRLLLRSNADV